MAGIYIHIPFCRKACVYCNFHFSTSLRLKDDMLDALVRELSLRKSYLRSHKISSIYFGGGTPSLLEVDEFSRIFENLLEHFSIKDGAEITLEANPDDLTQDKLRRLKQTPINRLSIGIQSFFDEDLSYMGRVHTAAEAHKCLEAALTSGFDNITTDLIYGTPTLSSEHWQKNLDIISGLGIPHLSAYQLTVEPRTALAAHILKGKALPPDDDVAAEQFHMLTHWAQQHSYEHYEISNLARPGRRAVHNSSYWSGEPYLGIGPSAHSFDGSSRSWNVANNAQYIRDIRSGVDPATVERLSIADRYNETVMTGFRLIEGVSLDRVSDLGEKYTTHLLDSVREYIERGMVYRHGNALRVRQEARLFADRIASDCFYVE